MKSSILVVGHPSPAQMEFGADAASSFEKALKMHRSHAYAVVVVSDTVKVSKRAKHKDVLSFLLEARATNPDLQSILVAENPTPQSLQKTVNEAGLFKVITNFEISGFQLAVREALEEYELIQQNKALLSLTQEQNQKLQQLSKLLEEKVAARTQFLSETRTRLQQATRRTEALNRTLVAIQKSITRQEIETHLNEALHTAMNLAWARILFRDQSFHEQLGDDSQKAGPNIFAAPLFRDQEHIGHVYFAREQALPFTPDEDDFLLQISDAVALAMDRIMAINRIEAMKQEWDSTFDSITAPFALVTQDRTIVRANRAYALKSKVGLEQIGGRKCFEVFFGRVAPCAGCRLGTAFDLGDTTCSDGSLNTLSVSSHSVELENGSKAFAMLYRDVSGERRMQRQILESSKMAELGTIGGSIAHEINNPLGGMIAFLQILKSEIPTASPFSKDIIEMEEAALRCKHIVENLLAFTRQSSSQDRAKHSLRELLRLAINIIELQTRGLGVKVERDIQSGDVSLLVDKNQIVQVLVNVMQNSCEALAERLEQGLKHPAPHIGITAHTVLGNDSLLQIEIVDNGLGIREPDLSRVFNPFFTTKEKTKNAGLGLSVSYQIIAEHGGEMEISSVEGQSTTVVIRLPIAQGR